MTVALVRGCARYSYYKCESKPRGVQMGTELDAQWFGRAKVADWVLISRYSINAIG
jgi:hypothetical protein